MIFEKCQHCHGAGATLVDERVWFLQVLINPRRHDLLQKWQPVCRPEFSIGQQMQQAVRAEQLVRSFDGFPKADINATTLIRQIFGHHDKS